MNKPNPAPEPTMEEILASIRRIISDGDDTPPPPVEADEEPTGDLADSEDEAGETAAAEADIFDLTDEMVAEEPEAPQAPATAVAQIATPAPPPQEAEVVTADLDDFDRIPAATPLAGAAAEDIVDPEEMDVSFADPAPQPEAPPPARPEATPPPTALLSPQSDAAVASAFGRLASTILNQDPRTLEDLVGDMLRPLLKEWLDDNLPVLVERLVREEIERVSRGRR